MKIAVSSDLHLDLNHMNVDRFITQQVRYLTEQKIDYYFFAGDAFNDFNQTKAYFTELQSRLPYTKSYYLAGNHDMLKNISYEQLENFQDDLYFHNHYVDIPRTNWRIIGNNGWYDYSFSTYEGRADEVARWKHAYWVDRTITQPMSDQRRMEVVLQEVKGALTEARIAQKRVILMTHFVPIKLALPQPIIESPHRQRMWEMTMAMMGSKHLGDLIAEFPEVKEVFYGHLHYAQPLITVGNVNYRNQAVGVWRKSNGQWKRKSLLNQWIERLYIKDLELF
ncbi:metallophosphoesterase [Limosilactobacillus sp. RRLNB_1_1]|uniref:Metallophosphoesterase n=1 Tax=Limosilactobacillus albertensis TaxID=2759752 RepID=A0A7W3Y9H0_9LACO|nr:metallophosphoesterase [Limosilactobacillus albertensis]MBB1070483.1 metallophosphoesterase [Limosilactobacillus albertensis]MCD7118864.1 metallophosphoesterase [Limosilactobacillus albertensis]MCD7129001.1 metallophosphoesterase [Limosilactobacillus albertensis]